MSSEVGREEREESDEGGVDDEVQIINETS